MRFHRFPLLVAGLIGCFICLSAAAQQQTLSSPQLVARGDALLAQGHQDEAKAVYTEAIALDAEMMAAYIGLAKVALAEENWKGAGNWLDRVLARDPDHMEAHYYRAISHREVAKFHSLLGIPDWKQATRHFEWVIERDSLYRDVLYQLAILRRYGGDYTEAIELGHDQVRLKPELTEPRRELFRLYQYYLQHADRNKVQAWLDAHPSAYSTYFGGELLRREGKHEEADAVFAQLLSAPPSIPVQPVLLSRARVHYALGQPEEAQPFVEEAIQRISSPVEARLVFEDFKYIFSDGELAQYRALRSPEEQRAFLHTFWTRRDPVPASTVNARLAEHYRRLLKAEQEYAYDGLRTWYNDPDKMNELDFPHVYILNQEFNDKGLVYIRHGEPDDRVVTVSGDMNFFRTQTTLTSKADWLPKDQSAEAGWVPNESWRYFNPLMDFHFVVDEGGGPDNWRLTPAITNAEMLEDREMWGGVYARLASITRSLKEQRERSQRQFQDAAAQGPPNDAEVERQRPEGIPGETVGTASYTPPPRPAGADAVRNMNAATLDMAMFREEMVRKNQEFITLGLTTDRHTWTKEVEPLEIPYLLAAFRGERGETQLEIHFALPIGRLTQEADAGSSTIQVEVGCALFDAEWQEVDEQVQAKHMPPVPDLEAAVIDYCQLAAPPDSYHVAFHNRPLQTSRLGGYKFDYRVPDLGTAGLAMSDLLPASSIKPTIGPSRFNKGDLYVTANPFQRFSVRQPVYLYFEIYNLTYDAGDQTSYTVEYILTPDKPRRTALRLFGRSDQPALALQMERTGTEHSPKEYTEIDVNKVDPGLYTLTVKVTDAFTGDTVERSRPIELTK